MVLNVFGVVEPLHVFFFFKSTLRKTSWQKQRLDCTTLYYTGMHSPVAKHGRSTVAVVELQPLCKDVNLSHFPYWQPVAFSLFATVLGGPWRPNQRMHVFVTSSLAAIFRRFCVCVYSCRCRFLMCFCTISMLNVGHFVGASELYWECHARTMCQHYSVVWE